MATLPREAAHPIDPLFTARWSPRAFTGEPIPADQLQALLEAARWAPSAFNAQPWRFLYGHRETPAGAAILDGLLPFNQAWAQRASALVVVLSRTRWIPPGQQEPQPIASHAFDAGAAWASLALQAARSGWYAHAMGGIDAARLRVALDIPEDHAVHAVVAVGRLGDPALLPERLQAREHPSDRLPLEAIAAEGRFAFGD